MSSLNLPRTPSNRKKISLAPGHSPLDWAALVSSTPPHQLRGLSRGAPPAPYLKVPREELKRHKSKDDCWTSINGKVFNITPYLNFHPGGVDEIMKCAGTDGTFLFNKYHSWVNAERLLGNCFVGTLSN